MLVALTVAATGLTFGLPSPGALADDGSEDADDRQERAIRAELQQAPDLRNNVIDVDVEDGIAVLEGTVDSTREKREAQERAHVEGILGVNNRLKVRGAGK
jgi:osmotically-inducible protein OsmY